MQNRRKFLLQSTLAAGALTILRPLKGFALFNAPGITVGNSRTLTILHTANLKSQLHPLNSSALSGFGGLKRIQNVIEKVRKENSNILLVDAGDILKAGNNVEENEKFLSAFKKMSYDIIVPGNHDMVKGNTHYQQMVNTNNLNAVATNYDHQGVLKDKVAPYQIIEKGSFKIGIVGLGNTTKVQGISSSSILVNAGLINKVAAYLRNDQGCNLVVCISHEGFTQKNCKIADDVVFASKLTDVDILITGSESNSLYNTQIVRTQTNHEIIVSTSGMNGCMMGRIDITFNELFRESSSNAE